MSDSHDAFQSAAVLGAGTMGAGIAVQFKRRFGRVAELRAQGVRTGGVAHLLCEDGCWVYYLVTKVKYSHKPTLASLRQSLLAMAQHMATHGVVRLALPR